MLSPRHGKYLATLLLGKTLSGVAQSHPPDGGPDRSCRFWQPPADRLSNEVLRIRVQAPRNFVGQVERLPAALAESRPTMEARRTHMLGSRGGAYGPASGAESYDAQSTYFRQILSFIGFTTIKEIFVEPTVGSPIAKADAVAAGTRKAAELAAAF